MFHQEPGIYRDQLSSLLGLHAELWERRLRELDELPAELRRVFAHRVARTAAGVAAFVAMTAVFLGAAVLMVYYAFDLPRYLATSIGAATVATWGLIAAVYGVAYVAASRSYSRWFELQSAADIHANISYLSRFEPRQAVVASIARWERRGIAWPLMGVAVTAPLMIHYIVASVLSGELASLSDFGLWVGLAALVVGHVHYFVGAQGASFARDVVDAPDDRLPILKGRGWRALVVAVGTSLMPGLAAFGIPCVVVALTGLAFLPACYWLMHVIAVRERDALASVVSD